MKCSTLLLNPWKIVALMSIICSGSYAQEKQVSLLESAVCFANGTHLYQENGKYGFENFEKQLSQAIYDTVFSFGKRYCVAKQNDRYFVLGEHLEKRFDLPIIAAERTFDTKIYRYVHLKLVTEQHEELQYTINYDTGEPIIFMESEAWNHFLFYPSGVIPVNWENRKPTYNPDDFTNETSDWIKDRWVDSIRFIKDQRTYYFHNGKSVTRKASKFDEYIGMYYMSFRSEKLSGVVDISTGDTVFKQPENSIVELEYYKNAPFFEVIGGPNDSTNWKAYDLQWKLITQLNSVNDIEYENGRISEELKGGEDKHFPYNQYAHYNIYGFSDHRLILKEAVALDQMNGDEAFRIFRLQNKPEFYLLENDSIIYTSTDKKLDYLYLTANEGKDLPGNRLISFSNNRSDIPGSYTCFLTTKSGYFQQFDGIYEMYFDEIIGTYRVYHSERDKKHPEKSLTREGVYDPVQNRILFFDNEILYGAGKNMLVIGDSLYHLVDFSGKVLLDKRIEDYDQFEIGDQRYLVFTIDGKSLIYSEQLELVCDDCELKQGAYGSLCFLKRKNDSGYQLVNKHLEPVLERNNYVKDFLVINTYLVILGTDNTIHYLSMDSLNK